MVALTELARMSDKLHNIRAELTVLRTREETSFLTVIDPEGLAIHTFLPCFVIVTALEEAEHTLLGQFTAFGVTVD